MADICELSINLRSKVNGLLASAERQFANPLQCFWVAGVHLFVLDVTVFMALKELNTRSLTRNINTLYWWPKQWTLTWNKTGHLKTSVLRWNISTLRPTIAVHMHKRCSRVYGSRFKAALGWWCLSLQIALSRLIKIEPADGRVRSHKTE